MEIKNKLYPHPVLRENNDDYINSSFEMDLSYEKDIKRLKLNINFKLNNKTLEKMLLDEKVEYVVHIECPKTSYRRIITTTEKILSENLKDENILGKIQVTSFIVVKENILNYENESFNSDYFGMKFNLEKGTILAIGDSYKIDVDKEKESLGNVPSIFIICKKMTTDEIGINIEYNMDKIRIDLNISDYEKYTQLVSTSTQFIDVINSSLIFPTLIYVFEKLKNEFDEIEENDYRWFKALKNIFEKYGYRFNQELFENETSLQLAQKILDFPFSKSLNALQSGVDEGVEE
ncbi:hypothetical protein [Fusobacterium hominis]|uniref:Uncharacterized protein n=1 Tax=Fusobacterium hominis TaxID=2764326 RepID=A0A7G9GYB4_9FUSO|nr:hypothetical protein [Fusobacterium hominis]QNM15796.1 hypothetical protein H9Q81_02855 [Fusobacterium hominis]